MGLLWFVGALEEIFTIRTRCSKKDWINWYGRKTIKKILGETLPSAISFFLFLTKSLSLLELSELFPRSNADHVLRWQLHIIFPWDNEIPFVVASRSCSRFSWHIVATKAAQTQQQFEQFTRLSQVREGINCDVTSLGLCLGIRNKCKWSNKTLRCCWKSRDGIKCGETHLKWLQSSKG